MGAPVSLSSRPSVGRLILTRGSAQGWGFTAVPVFSPQEWKILGKLRSKWVGWNPISRSSDWNVQKATMMNAAVMFSSLCSPEIKQSDLLCLYNVWSGKILRANNLTLIAGLRSWKSRSFNFLELVAFPVKDMHKVVSFQWKLVLSHFPLLSCYKERRAELQRPTCLFLCRQKGLGVCV